MYGAPIIMVRIPLCCMPKWHAHPTRHVEEFWIILATIRVPSLFVLNRQPSTLILQTVFISKVNEFSLLFRSQLSHSQFVVKLLTLMIYEKRISLSLSLNKIAVGLTGFLELQIIKVFALRKRENLAKFRQT